jgi:radical SAM protein with 4Fe4S-binding SPASM domain
VDLELKGKMLLAFLAYSLRWSRVPVGPLFVTLETGNSCNLRCPMCPQSTREASFPEGMMSLESFEKLLQRVSRYSPIACLTLHLSAEPLLHPKLPEMLRLSENLLGPRRTGFASNGYSLTRQRAKEILDAGLGWIAFDFCADVETFERNRFPAKWQRTFDNLVGFLETLANSGRQVKVTIKNVDWREDEGRSFEELKKLFRGLPVSYFEQYRLHNWSGEFAKGASKRLGVSFLASGTYHPCSHLWFSLVIAYDGRVHLCCRDTEGKHIVGDTQESELEEIWNGAHFQKLRRLHAEGKFEEIETCAPCDRVWTGGYFSAGSPLRMIRRNLHHLFAP